MHENLLALYASLTQHDERGPAYLKAVEDLKKMLASLKDG